LLLIPFAYGVYLLACSFFTRRRAAWIAWLTLAATPISAVALVPSSYPLLMTLVVLGCALGAAGFGKVGAAAILRYAGAGALLGLASAAHLLAAPILCAGAAALPALRPRGERLYPSAAYLLSGGVVIV